MKYLKSFNEKWGINQDMESQCDGIYKEINLPENKDVNKFDFIYSYDTRKKHLGIGNIRFKLEIDNKLENKEGEFTHNPILRSGYKITLKNREDKGVLLHELKHLDYVEKNRRANTNKTIKDVQKYGKNKDLDGIKNATFLFYMYDTDEFQAKYHGYYSDIDTYIKKNISKSPTQSEIIDLVNGALKEIEDKCFTYYMDKSDFKFSDYEVSQTDLEKLLVRYIRDSDNKLIFHTNIFKDIVHTYKWGLKDLYSKLKSKLDIITKSEKKQIAELVKKFEKDITWKRRKYNRKFRRILTLMLDKYLPSKLTKENVKMINEEWFPNDSFMVLDNPTGSKSSRIITEFRLIMDDKISLEFIGSKGDYLKDCLSVINCLYENKRGNYSKFFEIDKYYMDIVDITPLNSYHISTLNVFIDNFEGSDDHNRFIEKVRLLFESKVVQEQKVIKVYLKEPIDTKCLFGDTSKFEEVKKEIDELSYILEDENIIPEFYFKSRELIELKTNPGPLSNKNIPWESMEQYNEYKDRVEEICRQNKINININKI